MVESLYHPKAPVPQFDSGPSASKSPRDGFEGFSYGILNNKAGDKAKSKTDIKETEGVSPRPLNWSACHRIGVTNYFYLMDPAFCRTLFILF